MALLLVSIGGGDAGAGRGTIAGVGAGRVSTGRGGMISRAAFSSSPKRSRACPDLGGIGTRSHDSIAEPYGTPGRSLERTTNGRGHPEKQNGQLSPPAVRTRSTSVLRPENKDALAMLRNDEGSMAFWRRARGRRKSVKYFNCMVWLEDMWRKHDAGVEHGCALPFTGKNHSGGRGCVRLCGG